MLSAIEKALCELIKKHWGIRQSLWDLVEGQKRNTVQLARTGAIVNAK